MANNPNKVPGRTILQTAGSVWPRFGPMCRNLNTSMGAFIAGYLGSPAGSPVKGSSAPDRGVRVLGAGGRVRALAKRRVTR